jgi:hypothetical protein
MRVMDKVSIRLHFNEEDLVLRKEGSLDESFCIHITGQ